MATITIITYDRITVVRILFAA